MAHGLHVILNGPELLIVTRLLVIPPCLLETVDLQHLFDMPAKPNTRVLSNRVFHIQIDFVNDHHTGPNARLVRFIGFNIFRRVLYYKTYEIGPEADWVVFVHGAGGSSAIWFKQIRDFQKKFNVLLMDLRGHGESRRLPVRQFRYTFDDVSRDIIEVLDHLEIKRAHFVGISLGSLIIRSLAEIDPDRVGTVVLGGAVTRLNLRSRVLVAIGNLFKHVVPYIWLYRFFAWIIMPRKRHKESRALFIREARKLCQKEFLRWFRLTRRVVPLLRNYEEREIAAPTLYLMGREDYMFLPAVQELIERHRRSILKVIEGAGHVCNVERPHAFNRHAIAFMMDNRLGAAPAASFATG